MGYLIWTVEMGEGRGDIWPPSQFTTKKRFVSFSDFLSNLLYLFLGEGGDTE